MAGVDVLIITALKEELDVLLAVTDSVVEPWRAVAGGTPHHAAILDGDAGPIRVAAARLTKMAATATAAKATELVQLLSPGCLAMCGVCAGHPNDTAIGDVVIGDRVLQHDEGKQTSDGLEGDLWVRELGEIWLHSAQELAGPATRFPGYAEADEEMGRWWFLEQLLAQRTPLRSVALDRYLPGERRPKVLEALLEQAFVDLDDEGKFGLTAAGRQAILKRRAIHGARVSMVPYHVLVGPIGSGNAVVADSGIWDRISRGGMRKVLAVEMEGAALGHVAQRASLPFVVVKGVMDHADNHKADGAKWFAARASAAVLCHYLRRVVQPRANVAGVDGEASAGRGSNADSEPHARLAELEQERGRLVAESLSTADVDGLMLAARRQLRDGRPLEPGTTLSGRYRLLERVGVGGFASVWRARDKHTSREIAVKILHQQWMLDRSRVDRFMSGARRMHALDHPAIVPIIEAPIQDGPWCYCAMKWFAGGDLRKALVGGKIDRQQALAAVARALEGLVHAHGQKVIHRDVKPDNILLCEEHLGYITDFDLAHAKGSTHGTRTAGMGTFVYAAPEQQQDATRISEKADVYGAGMTLLFVLMGKDPPAMVGLVARAKPEILDDLECGAWLRDVVKRAVAYEVTERKTTCGELVSAIQGELVGERAAPLRVEDMRRGAAVFVDQTTASTVRVEARAVFRGESGDTVPRTEPSPDPFTDPLGWASLLKDNDSWAIAVMARLNALKTPAWASMLSTAESPEFELEVCKDGSVNKVFNKARSGDPQLESAILGEFQRLALPALPWYIAENVPGRCARLKCIFRWERGGFRCATAGRDSTGWWASFRVGDVKQRMRWIESGTFLMGSPAGEAGRRDNEGPQHEVTLTRGFWMADTPCTQALWEVVMGNRPSRFQSPQRPVEQVSWDDVQRFINQLNELTGGVFGLPTEAQWEYACRARTKTATYAGPMDIRGVNDVPILHEIAWYGGNSGVEFDLAEGYDTSQWPEKQFMHERAGTREVGSKRANTWGVYDTLGNVWEWCSDRYGPYEGRAVEDPSGPPSGQVRVNRGGSWRSNVRGVRAAYRNVGIPDHRYGHVGFRLVRGHELRQAGERSEGQHENEISNGGRPASRRIVIPWGSEA